MNKPVSPDQLESLKRAVKLKRLQAQNKEKKAGAERAIAPVERSAALPLSWAQQRLWFLDKFDAAAGAAYHLPAGFRLQGELDRNALKTALDLLTARHESLRTTFVTLDGQAVQVIGAADIGFAMSEHDLSGLGKDEQARVVARIQADTFSTPFDLAQGPLVRAQLLRLGAQDHLFLLNQHHIVTDGWSIGVLISEMGALYSALRQGRANPLPPLPIQYADYAAWQRAWLQGDALAAQIDYWKQHLDQAPELLALPTDRPRPAVQSHAGGRIDGVFSAELSRAIKQLGQRHGTTLYMTLLAGWAILMARLSAQSEVVIGTPIANRERAGTEGLIGFFVNTLALRFSTEGEPTVAEFLAQVKTHTLNAYAHQDLPFEQVVEALKPTRSLAYNPLFQTMLTMNDAGQGPLQLPGLQLAPLEFDSTSTHFDLHPTLTEGQDGIVCHLAYASELFDESTVRQCFERYRRVLEAMVADAAMPLSRIALTSAEERQMLLADFNRTTVAYPHEQLIHRLFEAQAAAHPQAMAVVSGAHGLSYGELNRRANQLAHALIDMGVKPDQRVALCVERSVEMAVGLLGILKSGAAYVPMEALQPRERLGYLLADSGARVLLTQAALVAGLPSCTMPVWTLDTDAFCHAAQHDPDPAQLGLHSHHLAYVIYTSGSTGAAKGVMVEHHSALNFWQAMKGSTHQSLPAQARVALNASYAFDMSWKGWLQLLSGHCVHLIPQAIRADGKQVMQFLEQHCIDVFDSTPSQLELLLDAGLLERGDYHYHPRAVLLGGEAIAPAMWARLQQARHIEFFNMYGPTEATVDATLGRIEPDAPRPHIGRPLDNAQIYILDAHLEPLPLGIAGEIYIGGAGVARGYLDRPELTAERFPANPFGAGRLYKTGDLGRWLADGNLDYLGRNDFQVKIRGFRIELGEIEAALRELPQVREALVLAHPEQPTQRLVAYLVPHAGAQLELAELRHALATRLAEHMVPSAFVMLDKFPLTANGKLDRRALPAPDADAMAGEPYQAPRGANETALAQVWQALLDLRRVGRDDHFFALGGHSLLVIDMLEELRTHQLALDMQLVFANLSLAELAAATTPLEAEAQPAAAPALIAPGCTQITPALLPLLSLSQPEIDGLVARVDGGSANIQDIYPLVPLQEGILFHYLLESEGDPYLSRSVLSFDTRARLDSFLLALQQVIDRHDILRSAVFWEGLPQPLQVVCRQAPLPVHALTPASGEDSLAQLLRHSDPRRLRLDLGRAPLLAAYTIALADSGEYLLAILNQHMVSDHVSLESIMGEIHLLLQGQAERLAPPIPFRNFIAASRAVSVVEHQAYFERELGGVSEATTPFGIVDTQGSGAVLDQTRLELSDDLAQKIRAAARQHGVSPAVLFHLAWGQVLAACTGQDDVVFGTVLSGRMRGSDGVGQAVGLFLNTLPLRVSVGRLPAQAAVAQCGRRLNELLVHEQASLVLAQRCSGVPAGQPLFSTLLNYRHSPAAANGVAQWQGMRQLAAEERSNYPISASVDDRGRGFGLTVQAAGVASDRMADYLQRGIEALANALIVAPQTNLCTLPLLPPAETQRLLRDFNDTAHDYPHEALIHGRFEQHAASHPDAIALVAGAVSVSYGALNRRANRLAHRLLALGIKPDGRVAICAAREVDMVVAMLATLKAGAGYVPLDPAYPADRLAYLLEDSAPQVLLVRGALRAQFPGSVPVLCLDDEAQLDACPDHNPEVPGLSARNLGYVIYTSGSTGQPKGVMVEHRNVLALVVNKPDVGIVATDCMAHCASPAFDASSWELWAALLNGARVLLVPQEILLDPRRFNDTLLAGGVSVLFLTVGVFNAYLDVLKPAFARLRLLLIGGDALDPRSVARALLAPAPGQLINLYGPTETTTFSTSHRIEAVAADARSIPLGRPIGNTQIYLLDAHLRPVPFGVAGEIHIAGAGVARGYFNRPALTEERFLADPFSAQPDARMYKTGDLGRWLADGTVEYLGRNDFQVKIRGFRIEPGEIEAQLVRCAGVREAVVLAREDVPGDKRLVAYLIGTPASAAELRAELGQTLAEYMLPAAFVTLERFPLTPHGKLDRKALPAPDQAAVAARAYQAPQGEVETALARIWSELLAVQQVGRDDNFFALGGHSLLAVQLISRIRSGMGLEANLRDLFTRPTLAAFAVSLAQARQSTLGAIPLAERGARLPLSWAQQRLWFLGRLDAAAGAAYHVPAALRLSGRLDTPALRATLDRIVARHEILRTTFVMAEGEPAQSIGRADIGFALDEQDLSALGAAAQPGMVDAIGKQFFSLPFELEQGPLIAGRLLRLAPDEHVLLINQHHIVTDGWSIEVLVREVTSLYTAFSQGQADPLAPLAIQYADYAAWQRNWLQGAALQGQLDYWTGQLSGAPELLALPTDRPRPAVQSYAGDALAFTIPAPLSAGLKQLGARHGATLFMTLLAGWGILMARLSGQTDVVVGSPVANRQRSEVEPMIGFFVNTLALRIDTEGAPSVAELLAKVRGLTLDAYAHQDVPFEQVVDALKPTRSLSHSPLFQTLLTLNQASERGELVLPGLRLSGVERKHETAHFDLALGVTEAHEQLHGHMTYATALFDGDTIARLARCYVAVLGEMVADDSQSVARLQLLSDAERRQLTQGFNDTARPYPDDKLIHQLFEAHAARTPEALALVFGEASLSYAQLNRKANQLAHRLRALGIGPDQLVAVAAERSLEMVIGVLAVLKAGAAFVPIDPSLPPERIAYMLADSAPKALLVQAPLRALLPPCAMPVLLLDAQAESADADADAGTGADGNLAPAALGMTPDNLAYVIYTSGSTGMPKGVQNHHRGLCNLIPALNEVYAIGPDSRLLQFVSFGFDVCVSDLMMALCSGASLHLAPKEALLGEALLHTLRRHAISHVGIPVGVLAALPADADLGLQTLITGGDVLSASLAQQWSRGQLLVNSYGPTEATVCSTVYACSPNQAGAVPIGKPLPNTQLYILDDLLQAVPLGVAGEIYIGGLGVARGYLNRAELTAERFLVNPFGPGRLYKTGDLGRWLADGNVEFLGRKDFQVKIRGFRIELGEIEARLAQCRGVREAVVLARQDQPGEKRLVAYLTGTPGSAAELRAELSTQLADYMLPAAFVVLDQLPLTSNGKIDRQALPAPDMTAAALRQYAAPQGELECVVAGIWQDLLGLARVGRNDHFFELGGHSLLAVQLMTRIRASLGLEVELRELFAHPVLGDFATALGQARRAATTAIPLADRGAGLPLSWAQQRLWFLDQLDPGASAAYHMPAALRLAGRLDLAALKATLDRVVARHENLRTTFALEHGAAVQRIADAGCGFALAEHDLGHLGGAEQRSAVERGSVDFFSTPFDLAQGPLIRGQLLRLGEDEHLLLINQHHIISDGWSIGLLVREVSALYAAYSQGRGDPLPPLALQYADYAVWQRDWLQGEALQAQLDYWRGHLAGVPELLALPTDHPRPAQQSHAGASVDFTLTAELTQALKQLSRRHGATLFMTLLTGWGILMSRVSGQSDVVVGSPIANRQRGETEHLIGFFVNTLALRVNADGDPSVAALLARMRAGTLDAYAHQDVPFEQVVDALKPQRSMSHSPLFQTMFAMNNTPGGGGLSLPGLQLSGVATPHTTAQFDLSLSMSEAGDSLVGGLIYSTALFEADTARRLVGYLRAVLQGMVEDDQQSVSRLNLLDAVEREQLTRGWNDTDVAFPRDKLLHQMFEEQVLRSPGAEAVRFEGEVLSYAELNKQANQLAHRLLALGVEPDARVAICAERSLGMVVGLLAILKAGGAYVPLDPDYPAERLAYMLADCAPQVVLTHSGLPLQVDGAARLQYLDDAGLAAQPVHNPVVAGLKPSHLAYVIYTSGSTGQPKGAMNQHDAAVSRLCWAQSAYRLEAGERVLQKTPISFDVSVWELFWPLLNGATLVVAPPKAHQNPRQLGELIVREQVTTLLFVPSMLDAFMQQAELRHCAMLRRVLCSGEALPYALQQRFLATLPQVELHNLYGPTEAGVHVSHWRCNDAHPGIVPIGWPLGNTTLYVLDGHLQPVPQGVSGEIYIGGIGVARGYLHRPQLTAERFIADPFSAGTLYKTGDVGRWLADGAIECLGRNDFQVKIRGLRIELGEIEARLAACEGVREAVVLAREDVPGDKRLVAYLTGTPGGAAELRSELGRHLAEYMVPLAFVTLERFPLTPNGKLDRQALPAPDMMALAARPYAPPEGELEQAIAAIWQDLLGLQGLGRNDHFFELGGHSLLAVQLMSRLREVMGIELGLRELFSHPVLSAFAYQAGQARRSTLEAIPLAERGAGLPLSWAQQRLWFLDQLAGGAGGAYHMPAALRLAGQLDTAALRATLDRVVARHESLRTSFALADGEPVQRIGAAEGGFALAEHDLCALDAAEREAAGAALSRQFFDTPFDLAHGPLIRGLLLRLDADEHMLLIDQHHIISDGWSLGVLVREVSALYTAFSQGLDDPLAPLAIQYADYAVWQRAWLQGDALQAQLDYWKGRLADAPELLALPSDHPRPAVQSFAGSSVGFALSASLTEQLRQWSHRHGGTLFMTLTTAWGVLMSRMSGQSDVVIGTPVANRQRIEIEHLIGYFLNTLALRVTLDDEVSVAQLYERTKSVVLDAYAHQEVPLEQVLEAVNPPRSVSHNALFQTMLSLNNNPAGGELRLPGLRLSSVEQKHESTYCDLYLALAESGGALGGALIYATDLFEADSMQRLLGYFQNILEGMVADPAQAVSRLALVGAAERTLQLETWNASAHDFPLEHDFAALFAQQVARDPSRIAASCGDASLSYGELDARAARVAKVLLDAGAGRDVLVTLVSERNLSLLTMMVAVLKAGAAFLPLDVKHPPERLREIVEMSGSPLLLVAEDCAAQAQALAGHLDLATIVLEQHWCAGAVPAGLPGAAPGDLAYVIFTSGSTGKPKGAMVEQLGMLNHMFGKIVTMNINAQDGLAQTASAAFDICVWQMLSALLVGGRTVVLPDTIAYDPSRLLEAVEAEGVTLLQTVPSMMRSLLDGGSEGRTLARLRYLIPTGEALGSKLSQDWFTRFPAIPLMNVYGPAECSDDVTWHAINARPDAHSAIPIGRPTPNNRIYILDRAMQPVPIGVKGEICVGGLGVGRGYLNSPQQTAAAFVDHPLGGAGRLYRTGDLGSYRADGLIDFHGRLDFQVKIRGFRIELGEIEARLAQCAGVHEALVLAREDVPGDKRLVAYLTGSPGGAAELRAELGRTLAEYMLPAAFVVLERFPLTPNGKIDRKALPAPDLSALASRDYVAPQGEVEEAVAQIWREVLGVERVGRNDHFFELGGSSLSATQVFVRLRKDFEVELPLVELFQHPLLADLAEAIVSAVLQTYATDDIALASASIEGLSDEELDALLEQERSPN